MRRRRLRRTHVTAGAAFLLVAALALSVADRSLANHEPSAAPAPPAALARVAAKNEAAAMLAAARQKAESEAQAAATERLLQAEESPAEPSPAQ